MLSLMILIVLRARYFTRDRIKDAEPVDDLERGMSHNQFAPVFLRSEGILPGRTVIINELRQPTDPSPQQGPTPQHKTNLEANRNAVGRKVARGRRVARGGRMIRGRSAEVIRRRLSQEGHLAAKQRMPQKSFAAWTKSSKSGP